MPYGRSELGKRLNKLERKLGIETHSGTIETIHLTRSQCAADAVTEFCGSWTFIISFSLLTGGWIALNSALILFGIFDPYPYILLNLFLTVISTFQSPLIMMSQNRQMERDRDAVQGLHAKLDEMAASMESPGKWSNSDAKRRTENVDL